VMSSCDRYRPDRSAFEARKPSQPPVDEAIRAIRVRAPGPTASESRRTINIVRCLLETSVAVTIRSKLSNGRHPCERP
jgi:hypothetical protein